MKKTLRQRYFLWLVFFVLSYYLAYAVLLFAFNRHEMKEFGHDPKEEFEEFLILVSMGGAMIPIMLLVAWDLSARMVKPLRRMAETARHIGDGQLAERLATEGKDDEVSSLANTLNQAFDRYQKAVDGMHQFSANASHQLRTPLAALRSAGEVALQRDRAPEDYRETISGMLEEGQRLARVVDQLLLLARLESTEIQRRFTACDMSEVARSSVELAKPLAEIKEVSLSVEAASGASIKADAELIRHALINVLDNAIKHTPARSKVTVRVVADADFVLVQVADSGPGISEEFRHQLFERFQRGGTAGYQGTGIGLAIVAQIVRLHGGSIEAASAPGIGASFTMRFPAEA